MNGIIPDLSLLTLVASHPLGLFSFQVSAVLPKLDDLRDKEKKIEDISSIATVIKAKMFMIGAVLSALEPRVSNVEDSLTLRIRLK